MIREFQGPFRFLSNFIGGVEQKYQAAKCAYRQDAERILAMTPGDAKREGRKVAMTPLWTNQFKLSLMETLLREKFQQEPHRSQLLATGDQEIQEGNRWHDTFWGVDLETGKGHNHLGKIIMKIRKELKEAFPLFYPFFPAVKK